MWTLKSKTQVRIDFEKQCCPGESLRNSTQTIPIKSQRNSTQHNKTMSRSNQFAIGKTHNKSESKCHIKSLGEAEEV